MRRVPAETRERRLIIVNQIAYTGSASFGSVLDASFWQHETLHFPPDRWLDFDRHDPADVARAVDDGRAVCHDYLSREFALRPWVKVISWHNSLTPEDAHRFPGADVKLVTMLRDPVTRFLSSFMYWPTSLERLERAERTPAADFNYMTTHLSGAPHAAARREDLERAKENLIKHACIGLTERFDESVDLFYKVFNLPNAGWRQNRGAVNPYRHTPIPDAVKARIRELSALDMELYAFATQLFAEMLDAYRDVALRQPSATDRVVIELHRLDRWRAKWLTKARGFARRGFKRRSPPPDVEELVAPALGTTSISQAQ